MPPRPKAFSYSRVSSDQQVSGRGLDRQDDAAAAWCSRNGYELDTTLNLTDAGRSAFTGEHIAEGGALGAFLALAKQERLGPEPVLLVEAIDRLSRMEPMDGLRQVIFALVDAGVAIVTLEDGARIDRAALNSDPASLIVLVVRIQSAHDYSRRLGARVHDSWQSTIATLKAGGIARPLTIKCRWHDYSEETGFVLNDYANVVRRIISLMRDQGGHAIARELNADGIPTPRGKSWTPSAIRQVVENPAVVGHLMLFSEMRGKNASARAERYKHKPLLIRNVFPPVVTEEELAAAQAARATRRNNPGVTGPNQRMLYFGQGLSRCTCGSIAGLTSSKYGGRLHHYVRCGRPKAARDGCKPLSYKLLPLHHHLLARLQPEHLAALVDNGDHRDDSLKKERTAEKALQGSLALAQQEQRNAAAAVKSAAKSGVDLSLLKLLSEASTEATERANEIEAALSAATRRVAQLLNRAAITEVSEAVQAVQRQFLAGTETPEQRRALNAALRRAGISIHLDPNGKQVGLQSRDAPIQWQPLKADLARIVLEMGGSDLVVHPDGSAQFNAPSDLPPDTDMDDYNNYWAAAAAEFDTPEKD